MKPGGLADLIQSRRAQQSTPTVASSLPTYDQPRGTTKTITGSETATDRATTEAPLPVAEPVVHSSSLIAQFANIAPNCFSCGNACESRFAVPVDGQHYGLCKGCQVLYDAGHKDAIKDRVRRRVTPTAPPPSCSSCKQPFHAARLSAREIVKRRTGTDPGEKSCSNGICGDCFGPGCFFEADHLTNGLDTRIAEAQPAPSTPAPGAWATPCDEGLT